MGQVVDMPGGKRREGRMLVGEARRRGGRRGKMTRTEEGCRAGTRNFHSIPDTTKCVVAAPLSCPHLGPCGCKVAHKQRIISSILLSDGPPRFVLLDGQVCGCHEQLLAAHCCRVLNLARASLGLLLWLLGVSAQHCCCDSKRKTKTNMQQS